MTKIVSPSCTISVSAAAEGLPAWRPDDGVRANRTTTQADQAPAEAASGGVLHGVSGIGSAGWFSGGCFAQHLGNFGAVIKGGSGHSAYYGNEIYRGDIEAGWSRITNPDTGLFEQPTGFTHSDNDFVFDHGGIGAKNGEHWTDGSFSATRQNQPGAFQWYSGGGIVLPPNVGGAGVSGALVTPYREAMTRNSGRGLRSHILQFDTNVWSRYSANLVPMVSPFAAITSFFSQARNKIWVLNLALYELDLNVDPALRLWTERIPYPNIGYTTATGSAYSAFYDRLFYINVKPGGIDFLVINPAGTFVSPTMTGTAPTPPASGLNGTSVWVEERKCFYHYQYEGPGNDVNTLYKLSAPASDTTQPWTWSSETMSGDTPVNDSATAQFTRMYWSERAQVLVWHGRTDASLQVWTPR